MPRVLGSVLVVLFLLALIPGCAKDERKDEIPTEALPAPTEGPKAAGR